jgi:hypothetical protein
MEKTYALNLADDGRILSVTYSKYATEDAPRVDELPDGDLYEYRFVDGDFIYDPLPVGPLEPQEKPTSLEARVGDLEEALGLLLSGVTE